MAGNHHKQITHTVKAISQFRASNQVWRKPDARKIANVFAIRHHGGKQVQLNDPAEPNLSTRTGEL